MVWTGTDPMEWAKETQERLMATVRTAAQGLAAEMNRTIPNGGSLPIKTGNLARSLLAQVGTPVTIKEGPFVGQDIGPVLLSWEPDETLYFGWQAIYARRMNYGFVGEDSLGRYYNQSGFGFVEKATAKWPNILSAAAQKVQGQSSGF